MYKLFRNIHLLTGLSSALLILVYAVSAVQMAHQFRIRPRVTNSALALTPGLDARPVAELLMNEHGMHGDLNATKTAGDQIHLTIVRPGTNYAVDYDRATGRARIQQRDLRFMGLMNRLHHLNGFGHWSAAMNAWAWVLAWVSVALLVLGATGLYMWFRLYKERLAGSILLGVNLCVSIVLLIALRL